MTEYFGSQSLMGLLRNKFENILCNLSTLKLKWLYVLFFVMIIEVFSGPTSILGQVYDLWISLKNNYSQHGRFNSHVFVNKWLINFLFRCSFMSNKKAHHKTIDMYFFLIRILNSLVVSICQAWVKCAGCL